MQKKRIGWILCLAFPFLLLVPFNRWDVTAKQFRTVVLHPQKTGITTLNFFDAGRERPVVTEIWYPVSHQAPSKPSSGIWVRCDEARDAPMSLEQKKYPLIVMSHGNGGDRFNISWLAEVLAANGYIVAAMDHYGNTWNNKIAESYVKPWERPKDISFVIDQLLSHELLRDRIDTQKIGFAGYSLGGATGMWVAGAQVTQIPPDEIGQICIETMPDIVTEEVIAGIDFKEAQHSYCDKRISAVMVMAPALGWLFDENSLKSIQIPVHIIAVAKDRVVPMEKNARIFANMISKATLTVLNSEADHYVFLNRPTIVGKRLMAQRYCEDPATVDRKKVHEQVGKAAVAFFDRHLNSF